MAKNKEFEIAYKEEGRRRAKIRKELRHYNRTHRYRTMECPDCGGLMHWCDVCEMWTKICCVEYGTCMCS